MKHGLTYDDVALIPQFNNVPSRLEPDLNTWLTKDIPVSCPIIPANMDCVISEDLARVIVKNGGLPVFHRFTTRETVISWLNAFPLHCFISSGVGKHDLENLASIIESSPVLGVCFDIAHGHSVKMIEAIQFVKKSYPNISVIAGNVCTPMGYQDLANAGADAVKVGIGGGAACTTRGVTSFGVPQFTAVQSCGEIAKKLRVPIIADGGIRSSREIILALAAGASTVMVGKLFAATEESAAKKISTPTDITSALYRGQASEEFQVEYYGKVKPGTVPEGESMWIPVSGTAQELIDRLLGGVRSGLTYGGARSIKELQRKAEFITVSGSYAFESGTRK